MSGDCLVIFLLLLVNLIVLWSKNILCKISIFKICSICFMIQDIWSILLSLSCNLRRIYILLPLSGMFSFLLTFFSSLFLLFSFFWVIYTCLVFDFNVSIVVLMTSLHVILLFAIVITKYFIFPMYL